ncbi:hypothetical protein D3C86_1960930 [compost metagenome]
MLVVAIAERHRYAGIGSGVNWNCEASPPVKRKAQKTKDVHGDSYCSDLSLVFGVPIQAVADVRGVSLILF